MQTKTTSWLLRISITGVGVGGAFFAAAPGNAIAKLGALTSGEVSTLHAGMFFAMVWIISSLRIGRLKALWRVGFGLKALRGASGSLLSGGPKARVAAGGSAGGAGPSGN